MSRVAPDQRARYLEILSEQFARFGLAVDGYCLLTNLPAGRNEQIASLKPAPKDFLPGFKAVSQGSKPSGIG